jgi:hypothetical protein
MIQSGQISPGKNILPFDIELPEFLPSLVRESGNGRTVGSCGIIYTIKTILKGSRMLCNYNLLRRSRWIGLCRPFKASLVLSKYSFATALIVGP